LKGQDWTGLLLAVALGAALRLVALDRLPPGLYHDEAFNGLDALRVLEGDRPIYFPANNGREPLYIYLVAGAIAWLGRTPGAVRLPAAIAGTLTIAAAYGLARALYNRRVAFFTAMITATTLWPVALSRQGFRAALLPLLIALCLWQAARAWRGQHLRDWALAGGLYGLSFYTYLAARLTPLVLLLFGLYLAWAGRLRRLWPGALVAGLTATLVALPLALYALNHADIFFTRTMQVSLFNPAIHGGDLPGALMRQVGRALGMFTLHGADEVRHNVPGRPVFDPAMSLAFLLGVWLALGRAIGGRGGTEPGFSPVLGRPRRRTEDRGQRSLRPHLDAGDAGANDFKRRCAGFPACGGGDAHCVHFARAGAGGHVDVGDTTPGAPFGLGITGRFAPAEHRADTTRLFWPVLRGKYGLVRCL